MMYKNKIVLGLCLAMACLIVVAVVPKIVHAATICSACRGTGDLLELARECPNHNTGIWGCFTCGNKGYIAPKCKFCGGSGKIFTQEEKEAARRSKAERDAAERAKQEKQKAERAERAERAKSYKYTGRVVTIGGQIWMAENLDNEAAGGTCYGGNPLRCAEFGRLYTWDDAMIACPAGWRLPSLADWEILIKFVGGRETAERKLKSAKGWDDSWVGTDNYGFSALPGGYGDGGFYRAGKSGYWWSATEHNDASDAYSLRIGVGVGGILDKEGKTSLHSVRCFMDTIDINIMAYSAMIKVNPNDAEEYYKRGYAYRKRGNAYREKGDYDRAIADFDQAIRLNPKYVYAYVERGATYEDKGDYDRAIKDYNEAIRLDPKYVYAYSSRGNAYYNKKDYDQAIADLTEAIRLYPNYANAYYVRGSAYYNKDDYDRAIADYSQVIRLNPNNAIAYNNRGNAYFYKKDYDQAKADFESALRINPNQSNARAKLEILKR